jgi:hypothetical protein
MKLFAFALAAPILVGLAAASADAAEAPTTVAQWARFEASYAPEVVPDNPFDPDEIDVRAEFVRAAGGRAIEVPAFWYQGYERALIGSREQLTPVGAPHFLVRFTPTRAGPWRWRWLIRRGGSTERLPWSAFDVTRARDPGFLRVSRRDPRHLAFDDGSSYFAVGENTGWYTGKGTFAYDEWFGALGAQGANWARLWMPSWAFGIEWKDTGLGDYSERLDRAWQLDHVLEEAERRDIYVMLALLNHGAFSTFFNPEWADNPYNVANGGPLAVPAEFFTNEEARRLFERRLRYIVARWGWSTHLMAWELWNEAELTSGYPSLPATDWHAHMAQVLRELDPYDHLVTTSHAFFPVDPNVWRDGGIDFTQIHLYADIFQDYRDVAAAVETLTKNRLAATDKPVLFGEIGIDSRGPAETRAKDPGGIGVHDGLWAGVISGGIGTAMTWWWDNLIALEPELYYPMFGAVARFVDGIAWDRERFAPSNAEVTSEAADVRARSLVGRRTLVLWLKDAGFQWYSPVATPIADAVLRLDDGKRWCGRWYDPWTGAWLGDVEFRGSVPVPPFSRDVALRADRRCGR